MAIVPLRELFKTPEPAVTTTLGVLAKRLGTTVARLAGLVQEGWLEDPRQQAGAGGLQVPFKVYDSSLVVFSPAPEALLWLAGWFQQPTTKGLFSLGDLAELTGKNEKAVLQLAAREKLPATHDPGFGLMFSAWAAKKVVLTAAKERAGRKLGREAAAAARFDRQAILWWLLAGEPDRAERPPRFDEQLEAEIERVAGLAEPQRGVRAGMLLAAWRDAKRVMEAAASATTADATPDAISEQKSSAPSRPESPPDAESRSGISQRVAACEREFSRLL